MSGEVFTEEQRNTIRWYFGAHGEQPKSGYASAGISTIENMVEAIVAARVASAAAEAWDEGARQGGANEYRSLETQVRNPYRAVLAPAADAATTGGEGE